MTQSHWIRSVSPLALLAAAAGLSTGVGAAAAQDIEVIYTKISTHPTSLVPGARDLAGMPVETRIRALEDFTLSPDGSTWIMKSRNQLGSDLETMVLIGSGTTGEMFLQEGQPVPAGQPGELVEFIGSTLGRFDSSNRLALSIRARGGVSSMAQKVMFWDGESFTIPFSQGTPVTGLEDSNGAGNETFGNSVGSIHLLDDGRIGSQDSTITNIFSSYRPAIFYNTAAFHQSNVTTVLGLDGVTTETWATIDSGDFYTTPDGAHWYAQGRFLSQTTLAHDALVIDGQAVYMTNSPIGDSGVVVNAINQNYLAASGDLYSRGTIVGDGDWAAVNGEVVAQTNMPIPGTEFSWGDTFLSVGGNANGDWVVVGNTNNPDIAADTVVVVNGEVVMTEGDPIDLDGNGVFDDDVFLGRGNNTSSAFEANDVALSDDKVLYIIASIRNGTGQDLNSDPAFGTPQAFLRLDLGGGTDCPVDWNEDGTVNSGDISSFLTAWIASVQAPDLVADFNGDGQTNSGDISAFLTAWIDAVTNGC